MGCATFASASSAPCRRLSIIALTYSCTRVGYFAGRRKASATSAVDWLNSCFARLHAAGIEALVHETGAELDLADCTILPANGQVELAGVTFISGLHQAPRGAIEVRCVWGKVTGIPTARGDANLPHVDAQRLADCPASYIALAGTRKMQLVQPNAAYAGATAPIDRWCTGAFVALLVEIGSDTGQLLSLTNIRLPSRKVWNIDIDGSGMGADHLGSVILSRLDETLLAHVGWRESVIERLIAQHECAELVQRVNAIYDRTAALAGNGVSTTSWVPQRPLVVLKVANALTSRQEVWATEPRLNWPVEQRQVCQLIVEFDKHRESLLTFP